MKKEFALLVIALAMPLHLRPSEAVQAIKPAFSSLVDSDEELREIASGLQFTEGPVWIEGRGEGKGYLLFSDIPADFIYRWAPGDTLSVWRYPSGESNGLLLDGKGSLMACEHGNRRVSITRPDGSVETLCDSYRGKKLNSPNDIATGHDGSLWFTDPPYGLRGRVQEQPASFVFRLKPEMSEPEAMVDDFDRPNGIVFSPNKKTLYVADSRGGHIRWFDVLGDSLSDKGMFADISPGGPDGMCVDIMGRLYSSAGDGVHVFSPDGTLLGKILTPRQPTNCCFGGEDWKTLFITARPSVYSIRLRVKGLP